MKTYLQIWVMVCLLEENMLPFVIIFSLTAKQIQDLAYFLVLCHFPDFVYSKINTILILGNCRKTHWGPGWGPGCGTPR